MEATARTGAGRRGGVTARQLIVAALVLGAALRLLFGLGYWVGKPLTHDEQEYLLLARNLAAGRGFTYGGGEDGREHFGRAPLYPAFLAGITVLTGEAREPLPASSPASVKIVQTLLATAGLVVIALLAWHVAGDTAAAIAAWIGALYPPLVWMPAYVLSETLYSLLALSSALVLGLVVDRARRAGKPGEAAPRRTGRPGARVFAAAVLAGLAALTRPVGLFFLLLAGAWFAWRRQWRFAALLALGTGLVLAPWTARNIAETGRFVLIASGGGVNFWIGNHPLSPGEGDMAANPDIKRANARLRAEHPGLTHDEMEPIYYREAWRSIREHPGQWLALLARKAFHTVVPAGPSYTLHSRRYLLASVVSYVVLLPAALAGLITSRRWRYQPVALWLIAGSTLSASLVFFPLERFRIPVVDPVLIVCAAAWLSRHVTRLAPFSAPPETRR